MLARKVIQWTLTLLLMLGAGSWYAVHRAWQKRDAFLLEQIRAGLAEKVPDWNVEIESAKLVNLRGRVRLNGISITPEGETVALLHIPEVFVQLDPDLLLAAPHQVLIRQLQVSRPVLTLIRHADGEWNWQKLRRPAPSEQTPEVQIEHGSFVVRVEGTAGVPYTEIASRDVALNLLPAGARRYLVEGVSHIEGAGGLAFSGRMDLNSGAWELAGKADRLDLSPGLLEKASALAPAVGRQVAEWSSGDAIITPGDTEEQGEQAANLAQRPQPLVRPASQVVPARSGVSEVSIPNLGLTANVAFDFELRSDGVQQIPDYRVVAKLTDGQVAEPLSPVPLSGLQGEFLIENDRIVVHRVSAAKDESRLFLDGEVRKDGDRTIKQFAVQAANLWLDHQIRELLPPEQGRLFDMLNPSGRFTVKARYDSEAAQPLQLDELAALDCTIQHAEFPYPVTGLSGKIVQEVDRLTLELEGQAGGRPVRIDGEVGGPGLKGDVVVLIQVHEFPLDEQFQAAFVSPKLEPVRKSLESLNLTGIADLRVQFARRAGEGERFQMGVDADVSQASIRLREFPYQVEQVSGHVHFDPWCEPVWRFTEMQGQHGATRLTGNASFDLTEPPGQLLVDMNVQDLALDADLRTASSAVAGLQTFWSELNPGGVAQLTGFKIAWTPGGAPQVVIPSIQLREGSLALSRFPYRWDGVSADLGWNNGRVDVRRIEGRHNETLVVVEGPPSPPGDAAEISLTAQDSTTTPNEDALPASLAYFAATPHDTHKWILELPSIRVQNLDPQGEFLAALPPSVSDVVARLAPRGPIDAELGVQLKGFPQEFGEEIVTSHWRLRVGLKDDRLNLGVELTGVTGSVGATIRWNGEQVIVDGRVDFAKARACQMTCTNLRGPFQVRGTEITLGSRDVLRQLRVPTDEQLTASLYGGMIRINTKAQLDPFDAERSVYQAQINVESAQLAQYAREQWPGQQSVTGTVNGQMNLSGRGSSPLALVGDRCQMTITEAQLGELPQIMQILKQMTQLQQPDKTAFSYAYAEFSIRNGMFEFGSIDSSRDDTRHIRLDGNTLTMVGRGFIPFAEGIDPRMNLIFLSKVGNNRIPQIPLVSQLVKPIVKPFADNVFRLQITGTPRNPEYYSGMQVPIGNMNEVLRDLLQSVDAGLNPMAPRPVPR